MRRRRIQQCITVVLLVLCGVLLVVDIVRSIQTRTWPTGSGWIAVSILVLAMLQMRSRQPSVALTRRGITVVCLVSAVALTVQVVAVIVYGLPEAWLELAGAIGTLFVVFTAVSARRSAARYRRSQAASNITVIDQ